MISAPGLGPVREASARIEREIPELNRKFESLHEVEAQAERLRDDMIDRKEFIEDCDTGHFRPSLRVHPMRSRAGIWEMTWEGNDGRATFAWGPELEPGKRHVIWRQVGGHEIYANPWPPMPPVQVVNLPA